MSAERIQKVLAAAGYGARRACEEFVLDGRVAVNGEIVRELPVLVDQDKDRITVDGRLIRPPHRVYYLLNKPPGVLCTHDDPSGRKRAVDLLVGVRERVFPVGRLDAESAGLLIMTNDGELAQRLTHPRYGVPKTYQAEVAGCPTQETLDKLRAGVWLSDGKTSPAAISVVHRDRAKAVLEITIHERRNREVRRMLAKLGHKVNRLIRVRMGKLSIRGLPLGAFRPLARQEVAYLHSLAGRAGGEDHPSRPRRAPARGSRSRGPKTPPRPSPRERPPRRMIT